MRRRFANELGNIWGVGAATRNDGVVVLVDLGSSVTRVSSGSGLDLRPQYEPIAMAGDALFAVSAWDEGIAAVLEALDGDGYVSGAHAGQASTAGCSVSLVSSEPSLFMT